MRKRYNDGPPVRQNRQSRPGAAGTGRGGVHPNRQSAGSASASGYDAHAAQIDENLARLFVDLREVLGRTRHEAAILLATDINVITALETGNLAGLPGWPEVERVVTDYTGLAGIDATPVLQALRERLGLQPEDGQQIAGAGDPHGAAGSRQAMEQQQSGWRRGRSGKPVYQGQGADNSGTEKRGISFSSTKFAKAVRGVTLNPSAAAEKLKGGWRRRFSRIVIVSAVALIVLTQTPLLNAAISVLPQPLSSALVSVRDYVQLQFAPEYDGMRWLDVDDPRSRRADKLRTLVQ